MEPQSPGAQALASSRADLSAVIEALSALKLTADPEGTDAGKLEAGCCYSCSVCGWWCWTCFTCS
jgi:hypothetical protein